MTPEQRMIAALNFRQPDDIVPVWELEFHLYSELLGKELILGYEFEKLTGKEKEKAIGYNADVITEAAEKFDFSAVTAVGSYWEQGPGEPAYYWMNGLAWRLKLIKALKSNLGGRCMVASYSDSNVCIPSGNAMLDFVYQMEDSPEEIIQINERMLIDGVNEGLRMAEAGADILCNACDIAFNSGTFFTPEQLERFVYPYFKRWNEAFSKEKVYTVLHTDGDVTKIVDDIMNCGFHALQCIDPIAGMDIIELKKKTYGRMALVGNMNVSTLQLGTKDEIEKQARGILEGCKDGGGFVYGSCNAVFKGIPPENYLYMLECRQKHGRYTI